MTMNVMSSMGQCSGNPEGNVWHYTTNSFSKPRTEDIDLMALNDLLVIFVELISHTPVSVYLSALS